MGTYGTVFRLLGGDGYPKDLLIKAAAFRHLYVWSGVWQNPSRNTIIYISALSGIAPELYEAAEIDGASRLKRMIYIDFPVLIPTGLSCRS